MKTDMLHSRSSQVGLVMVAYGLILGPLGLILRNLYPDGAFEGAVCGWWWCVAASWLTGASFEHGRFLAWSHRAFARERARQGALGTGAWPGGRKTAWREALPWYVVGGLSLLGVMETTQKGSPAAFGFVLGAASYVALASAVEVLLDRVAAYNHAHARAPATARIAR